MLDTLVHSSVFGCGINSLLYSAYFIRYKVRGGAFDLAVEVTQLLLRGASSYACTHVGV